MAQSPFRSIRQTLFNEGKLLRYLGYAIGEIALIIIGIMLALQLNNWNEDRKDQAEFEVYLVQLKVDVNRAIEYMDYTIDFMTTNHERLQFVLKFLELSEYNAEELAEFEQALNSPGTYNEPQVYVGLLGQLMDGNMDIIGRDRRLAQKALEMETIVEGRLSNLTHIYNQIDHANSLVQHMRGRGTNRDGIPPRYNLETLKSSDEFKNAVYSMSARVRTLIFFTERIAEALKEFLAELEEY